MIKEFKKGENSKVSEHFSTKEFDCHCKYPECKITYIDTDHVANLEKLRVIFNSPIIIVSGFRCVMHNRDVKGKKGSAHLGGKATDIKIPGHSPDSVAMKCEWFDGLGRYDTFTHIDSRGYKARWDERNEK